uniref:Uncharacterized protein n=1 Tax=Rhizophora mucronata TaxID=61149 RepID=A0A2P2QND6_RHIMU
MVEAVCQSTANKIDSRRHGHLSKHRGF